MSCFPLFADCLFAAHVMTTSETHADGLKTLKFERCGTLIPALEFFQAGSEPGWEGGDGAQAGTGETDVPEQGEKCHSFNVRG